VAEVAAAQALLEAMLLPVLAEEVMVVTVLRLIFQAHLLLMQEVVAVVVFLQTLLLEVRVEAVMVEI
jgi:hypothetical protein